MRLRTCEEGPLSRMLTRQVEAAQKNVEGNNYDTRKQVLQYDNVMREQNVNIYTLNVMMSLPDRVTWPEIQAMIKRTRLVVSLTVMRVLNNEKH